MTGLPAWREEAVSRTHDRAAFDCGEPALNQFLAQHARQSHESGAAKTWCAVDATNGRAVRGFYTICPGEIAFHQAPLLARPRGAGRHALGGFRLARLAVATRWQGRSLGGMLLANAIERCIAVAAQVGGTALLIDAKDAAAAAWYEGYGALPLDDRPLSLVLPFAEFLGARAAAGLPPL